MYRTVLGSLRTDGKRCDAQGSNASNSASPDGKCFARADSDFEKHNRFEEKEGSEDHPAKSDAFGFALAKGMVPTTPRLGNRGARVH